MITVDHTPDPEYAAFAARVAQLAGIDLLSYKREQMRRRLLTLAARYGTHSLTAFADVITTHPAALAAFQAFFTINVSEFLRDPARWEELETRIVPLLAAQAAGRPLRLWSAGCATGAEPYSLAMVCADSAAARRASILATDIDAAILRRAARGDSYSALDIRNLTTDRRSRFMIPDTAGTYRVRDSLRARVTFARHDLLSPPLEREFDLILCRNVMIYLTDAAKAALFQRLRDALVPGGVLFVGGAEMVMNPRDVGLEPLATAFYHTPPARLMGAAYARH